MADTAIAITAGAGTNVDTRTEGTNGNHRQVIVLGDPATNAGVAPVDATAGLKVNLGADNDVTVSGTVDLGATDNAVLDAIAASVAGTVAVGNATLTNVGAGEYETVAASQTAQTLGATGATGDYISGILVVPASTSPGVVTLLDNATSISVFAGGASSVSTLHPFFIPLGMISVSGAWKITTGANVSCIGVGNFT
jgi:hypothetical protein